MPYSVPSCPNADTARSVHVRSHSHSHTRSSFTNEKGTGTFSSLGSLPRRKSTSKVPTARSAVGPSPTSTSASSMPVTPTSPVWSPTVRMTPAGCPNPLQSPPSPNRKFHFQEDADDSPEDRDEVLLSPGIKLKASLSNTFRLKLNTDNLSISPYSSPMGSPRGSPCASPPALTPVTEEKVASIPFPRAMARSPPPVAETRMESFSSNAAHIRSASSPRPSITRNPSTPIILSNGRPLKSSLKGSSSSPSFPHHLGVPEDARHHPNQFPHAHAHHHPGNVGKGVRSHHLRAQSAPSTPSLSSDDRDEWAESSPLGTPSTPKSVHFPEQDSLESVRLFKRRAMPAAVSRPEGEETETETEGEALPGTRAWSGRNFKSAFPFPRFGSSSTPFTPGSFELNPEMTSTIPAPNLPEYANIHLESLVLSDTAATLNGMLLVRNVVFEKHVAVRFTVDEWQTTSEVLGKHVTSLSSFPLARPDSGSLIGDLAFKPSAGESQWDRFSFSIRLDDYVQNLHHRTLWVVARFSSPAGEWWDNNSGQNYRVSFKPKPTVSAPEAPRRLPTLSAPPAVPAFVANPPPPPAAPVEIPPAPGLNSPTAAASISRISKFSLSNYAAPKSRSPSISPTASRTHLPSAVHTPSHMMTPPPTPPEEVVHVVADEKEKHTDEQIEHAISPPTPTPNSVQFPTGANESGQTTPRASHAIFPFRLSSSDNETVRGRKESASGVSEGETFRGWSDTEPRGARKQSLRSQPPKIVLPPRSTDPWTNRFIAEKGSSPAHFSPSIASVLGGSSPNGHLNVNAGVTSPRCRPSPVGDENLYDAMLKQWCFAQSPPPTPSALPGVTV